MSAPPNSLRMYQMTPPDGAPFQAAIDGNFDVLSNRSGEWKKEDAWKAVDLLHPEISFNEWDVKRLPIV